MLTHLVDASIRSLVLALAATLVLWILRRRRTAALHHAVWTAVAGGMLALFALGPALPRLPLRVLSRPAAAALSVLPAPAKEALLAGDIPAAVPHPATAPRSTNWSEVLVYTYFAIVFALLARFVTGMFLVRELVARSTPGPDGAYQSDAIAVPVAVGWLRPKILLPMEWLAWDGRKLTAVLAHERAHVRRRDGLVTMLARVNRCIFWFHPLAWILERKLSLLAEQACDEACVASLGDRQSYAQLLLDMAVVVDGSYRRMRSHALTMAAGSHIRQRIDSLLQDGRTFSRGLTRAGWLAVMLCGVPLIWGTAAVEFDPQTPAAAPAAKVEFEVASVKPSIPGPPPVGVAGRNGGGVTGACPESLRMDQGRIEFLCTVVLDMVAYAYRIPSSRVVGPDWLVDRRSKFDVQAKRPQGSTDSQVPEMFQALLGDRFKLAVHRATVEQPVLALVVAKGGLKMKEAPAESPAPPDPGAPEPSITQLGGVETRMTETANPDGSHTTVRTNPRIGTVRETMRMDKSNRWEASGISLQGMADLLDRVAPLKSEIVDMTGLSGRYQATLEISFREASQEMAALMQAGDPESAMMGMESGILKAMNDGLAKLGLQLERRKAPIESLVIDHVDRMPAGN